ncbi:hypothetical protein GCM10027589_55720 [Actinocorallia lasiicapitis]
MNVSTRVIDSTTGRGAAGLPVRLDRYDGGSWEPVHEGETDTSGRVTDIKTVSGTHRFRYGSGACFPEGTGFPEVQVIFSLSVGPAEMRLNLGPYAYSAQLEVG